MLTGDAQFAIIAPPVGDFCVMLPTYRRKIRKWDIEPRFLRPRGASWPGRPRRADRPGPRACVDRPSVREVNADLEIGLVVAGMVVGADSIDDMDLLRHVGMGRPAVCRGAGPPGCGPGPPAPPVGPHRWRSRRTAPPARPVFGHNRGPGRFGVLLRGLHHRLPQHRGTLVRHGAHGPQDQKGNR